MPTPITEPKLKDVTTNKNYPAYETPNGTIIQTNGPQTIMPSGTTLIALVKFVDNCGLKTVVFSGGAEKTGHSHGSFHYKDLAIDIAGKKFNKLTHEKARITAKDAGFTHGVYEDFNGTQKDHWHFQIGAGNGLTDKHKLANPKLIVKAY